MRFDPSPGSRDVVVRAPSRRRLPRRRRVRVRHARRRAHRRVLGPKRVSVGRALVDRRRLVGSQPPPRSAVFRALRRRLGGRAAPARGVRARDRAARDVRHLRRRRQRPAVASRRARRANRRRPGTTAIRVFPSGFRSRRGDVRDSRQVAGARRAQGGGETSGRRGERGGGRGGWRSRASLRRRASRRRGARRRRRRRKRPGV
mmetsp:Transcript_10513/g.43553  ORF Transcript_10513/g.43553 Transcript_10513/m.43553 type:complete len:203 (+) Transcript_10513:1421-2029(+)